MMFNQFVRPQVNTDATQSAGRGEPPRPAGFIRLVDAAGRGRAGSEPPVAVPQADGHGQDD